MQLTELLQIEAKLRRDRPDLQEWEIQYVIQKVLELNDKEEVQDEELQESDSEKA